MQRPAPLADDGPGRVATASQQPRARLRIAKTHLILMILVACGFLFAFLGGLTTLGRIPRSLCVIVALPMPFLYLLRRGALNGKPWARFGSIAMGALLLPGFPLLTLAGGYLILDASLNWNR